MQNLDVVSDAVLTYEGGPKNFGDATARPPWDGGVADP